MSGTLPEAEEKGVPSRRKQEAVPVTKEALSEGAGQNTDIRIGEEALN